MRSRLRSRLDFTCVLTPQVRELLSALLWDPIEERFEPRRLPPSSYSLLLLTTLRATTRYHLLLTTTHSPHYDSLRLTTTHYSLTIRYATTSSLFLATTHYYSPLLATTHYYSPLLATTRDYSRLPITTTYHYFEPSRLPASSSAALRAFYAEAPRGGAYAPDASARWHEMAPLYIYML